MTKVAFNKKKILFTSNGFKFISETTHEAELKLGHFGK
jgi:hypothetical protein